MSHLEKRLVHLTIAVATTLLTACSSQVIQGSTATGGGGAMEGSGGQPVTSGNGSGSGGGVFPPDCSQYADQQSSAGVLVHIVNTRTTSVFFRAQCPDPGQEPLHVIDGGGAGATHAVTLTPYVTACGAALKGQVGFGDCMSPTTVEIAPGAAFDTTWGGLFYDDVALPPECPVPAVLGSHCVQAIVPEPGPMVLTVDLTDAAVNPQFITQVDTAFVFGTDTTIQVVVGG
jgi:hypothetical protein